jgi:hypothetical protein
VLHAGRLPGERCVFVYDPGQWQAYMAELEKRKGLRGYQAMRAAADGAAVVRARDGELLLPPGVYQDFLGAPAELEVLRFTGRTEIWDPEDLEDYLSVQVQLRPAAPAEPAEPAKAPPPRRLRWTPE